MATIGTLMAYIGADTSDLVRGVRTSERHLKSLERNAGNHLGRVGGHFDGLAKRVVASVGTMVGVYGLARLSKSFLDAATESENFQVRLKVLLGSAQEGTRMFQEMSKYASKVPFEFREIMGAATQLSGIMKGGVDQVREWIPLIGDIAAASGIGIQKTTEQIIRMYSSGAQAAELFKERGILGMLGFQAGVSYTAEQTRKKLVEEWNKVGSQFKGATTEMAKTWTGIMSMMKDKWFQFRTSVMDKGPFEFMKTLARELDQIWANSASSSEEFARSVSVVMVEALATIGKAVGLLAKAFAGLPVVWAALKLPFFALTRGIQEGIKGLIDGVVKVLELLNTPLGRAAFAALPGGLGILGGGLEKSLEKMKEIQASQDAIAGQTRVDVEDILKAGSDALTTYENVAGGVDQWNAALDEARESALNMGSTTEKVAEAAGKVSTAFGDITKAAKKGEKDVEKAFRDRIDEAERLEKGRAKNERMLSEARVTYLKRLDEEEARAFREKIEEAEYLERRRFEQEQENQTLIIQGLRAQAKKQQAFATEMGKLWTHTMERIQDATADAFFEAFDKGFDAFSGFMDDIKDLFKRTLAEMVAQMATQNFIMPIMAQTVGAVLPGLFGGAGQVAQQAGQLPWLNGFMSREFTPLLGGKAVTYGGIAGAGLLGSLGYSTIGGMIGLPQGGYSGIGSGVGAAAGMAIGGPIGGVIGSLLGGIGGSLFGKHYDDADAALVLGDNPWATRPSDYVSQASSQYEFASQSKDFGHQEGTINKAVVEYFDGLFGILDEQFGVSVDSILSEKGVQVFHFDKAEKIVSGEGGIQKLLELYTDQFLGVYGDALTVALRQSVNRTIPGVTLTEDLFAGIKNINTTEELNQILTGVAERVNAIQSITGAIDDFLTTVDMSDTERAIWSINRAYDEYRATLEALGVDVTKYVKLEQWRSKQINIVMDNAKSAIQSQMDALVSQQEDIQSRILSDRDSVFSGIDDMIRELRSGQYAPVQSLESFENRFNELFSAAKTGSAESIQNLLQYIPEYLDFMSGTGDMKFITERIAQRLDELKPAVETNYQQIMVDETKGIRDQLADIYEEMQKLGGTYTIPGNTGYGESLPGYHSGGLATGLSIVGEKGPEWVVPTYEPERSNFLESMGVDPEAIGRAIAKAMMEGGGSGRGTIIVKIGNRAISDVMVDELDSNGRLVSKVENLAKNAARKVSGG